MPDHDPEDEGNRAPPHPMDRTWIHPSELAAARRPTPPTRARTGLRRDLTLALSAGAIGALATVTILGLIGAFNRDRSPVARAAANPVADAAGIAARVAPAITAVVATTGGVERRGSGVAVSRHEILTTTAVVAGDAADTTVSITTDGGRQYDAEVLGRDSITGLVLLEVRDLVAEPVQWSDATRVRAGDWVVAVGRMPGQGPWVTSGVVTAVGGWMTDASGSSYAGVITTSAELADDARGGALVDERGRVVGILATTASDPARTAVLPGAIAGAVATQLSEHGWATHGSLGVRAADSTTGVTITEIVAGSAAAASRLRVDDRITEIDGVRTPTTAALVYELRRRSAGARVTVTIRRAGKVSHVTATLDETTTSATSDSPAAAPLTFAGGS